MEKEKLIIENQKREVDLAYNQLHEKNKEVMDSIHYARRIQHSVLTNEIPRLLPGPYPIFFEEIYSWLGKDFFSLKPK